MPANAHMRVVGQRHELGAHEHERRVAAFADVRLEVLEQFLAALAGIDAPAVEHERVVHPLAAAERVGGAFEVRRQRLARASARQPIVSPSDTSPSGRSTPQPTTSSTRPRRWKRALTNRRSDSVFHTKPAGAAKTSS